MQKLLTAIKIAKAVYSADPNDLEYYENFSKEIRRRYPGEVMTEKAIRSTYDQWRRKIIADELRASAQELRIYHLLKDKHRRIAAIATGLLVLAIIFPPIYLVSGDQSLHLGFVFAFNTHVGRIDSSYLLCEILAIIGMYALAVRFINTASAPGIIDAEKE